jgi:hypothetical protein
MMIYKPTRKFLARAIQLEEALFQGSVDYISKVAKRESEVCKLIEDGFEFVCDFQGHKVFRKRK